MQSSVSLLADKETLLLLLPTARDFARTFDLVIRAHASRQQKMIMFILNKSRY